MSLPSDMKAAIVFANTGLMYTGPNHGLAMAEADDDKAMPDNDVWTDVFYEGFYSESTGFLMRRECKDRYGSGESRSLGAAHQVDENELGVGSGVEDRSYEGWSASSEKMCGPIRDDQYYF